MLEGLVVQNNGVPIYVQLRNQIAAAIGRGELKPGDRLPTMREVAVALAIDLNTVQRAYTVLEDEGLLTLEQGRGTFVASAPKPMRDRRVETDAFAAMVAAQARAQGVDLEELRDALRNLSRRAS